MKGGGHDSYDNDETGNAGPDATAGTMKAFVYRGPGKKALEDCPKPEITAPTDAIVKMVKTTICGTDLHILKGDVPTCQPGRILGHEGVGIVDRVGPAVTVFKPGDRVLISCVSACGKCVYCRKQMYSHCTTGGWILGNSIDGTQAEFVRTPYADTSLYPIPEGADEEALVMLSDILPTGFECGVLNGKVQPGSTVAIVGSGPVGLAALLTAQFFSPAEIIMIDLDDNRLEVAKRFGATTGINSTDGKAVDTVMKMTGKRGVDTAIEAVGIPATFEMCEQIVAPGGTIANIGVHGTQVALHLERLWDRNISITTRLVDTVKPLALVLTPAVPLNCQAVPPAQFDSASRQRGRLEAAVGQRVRHRRQRGQIDEGRAVGRRRRHSQQLDRMRAGPHGEVGGHIVAVRRAGGRDRGNDFAVDKHLDLLGLALRLDPLGRLEREVVDAGVQVDRWLMLPPSLIKATWLPPGALALPVVKPLPLAPALRRSPRTARANRAGAIW